jgi:HD-like signal output (HDOD) protein
MTSRLSHLIAHVQDLPTLPAVAVQLMANIDRGDIDLHALALMIGADQALAAKILRIANSSFYGMSSQIGTLYQAVSVLGIQQIRSLVCACSIASSLPKPHNFDFEKFWHHALATGIAARLLARTLRQNSELAFISGLLHNLGALVLAMYFPENYAAALNWQAVNGSNLELAEREIFGFDHCMVGAALAAHWNFPIAIQAAVGGAFDDAEIHITSRVIRGASLIANDLDLELKDGALVIYQAMEPEWTSAGLSLIDAENVWSEYVLSYKALCQILIG